MKRRCFIKSSALGTAALALAPLACSSPLEKALKISLAQWSLHRSFREGKLDPLQFASIARESYGISAVEYVNGFYSRHY